MDTTHPVQDGLQLTGTRWRGGRAGARARGGAPPPGGRGAAPPPPPR